MNFLPRHARSHLDAMVWRLVPIEAVLAAVLLLASFGEALATKASPPTVTCLAANCEQCIESEGSSGGGSRCVKCGPGPCETCKKWRLPPNMRVQHSGGYTVSLALDRWPPAPGETAVPFGGIASYTRAGKTTNGKIQGKLTARTFEGTVEWDTGTAERYLLTIRPVYGRGSIGRFVPGRATLIRGYAYPPRGRLMSSTTLRCQ